jgi:capsular exopolysaccharide synthesis family protein
MGILAAVLLTLPQPPVYQATGAVEIQGLNDEFLNLKNVDPHSSSEYSSETYLQTQIRILRSRTTLQRVEDQIHFSNWPEYQPGAGRVARIRKALGLPLTEMSNSQQAIFDKAAANLKVQASGLTRVVEISFDASDPQRAADFVNTLVTEFTEASMESRWTTTQKTSQWLNRQLGELKAKLERADAELQAYARATGLLIRTDKQNVAEEKLSQQQAELSRARADRMTKQARYELTTNTSPEALPEVLGDGMLRDYQTKLTELRRQYAELSSSLTPAHPRVQKVQAQITELDGTIAKERVNIIQRIRNEYLAAQERERLLSADYGSQKDVVTDQSAKAIHYNVLQREVESSRQLYDTMLQRVKEANIASALRNSNVRVVDVARAPGAPYKPNMPLNAVIGLFSGLVAGLGFVMVRAQMDRTIRGPGDPGHLLHVPELGVIPAARRVSDLDLVHWKQKPTVVTESFRTALTSILMSLDQTRSPKILVVTSPNPSEGKSTVSLNLAVALAEINRRVLLIDGDLRKPTLHTRFDTSSHVTLADFLQGTEPVKDMLFRELLAESNVPNLCVLAGGKIEGSATSLLYSPRLVELLALMRKGFDVVIIDTPPLLHIPDARLLSRQSDGVVLVIRADKTKRESAMAAAQRIAEDGTPILGTILNSWNLSKEYGEVYGSYGKVYGSYGVE